MQEDLQFVKSKGQKLLVGAVDLGQGYEDTRYLCEGQLNFIWKNCKACKIYFLFFNFNKIW